MSLGRRGVREAVERCVQLAVAGGLGLGGHGGHGGHVARGGLAAATAAAWARRWARVSPRGAKRAHAAPGDAPVGGGARPGGAHRDSIQCRRGCAAVDGRPWRAGVVGGGRRVARAPRDHARPPPRLAPPLTRSHARRQGRRERRRQKQAREEDGVAHCAARSRWARSRGGGQGRWHVSE